MLTVDAVQNSMQLKCGGRVAMAEGAFSPGHIQSVVTSNFFNIDMQVSAHHAACRTRLELVRLGQIDVLSYQSEGMQRGIRSWEHIRNDNSDYITLYMPLATGFIIEGDGAIAKLSLDSFSFLATSRPFSLVQQYQSELGSYSSMFVKIPGPLIRQRLGYIDDLCYRPFAIMQGTSGIMKKMVEAALSDGAALSMGEAIRFGETLLDVIVGAAESAADASGYHQRSRNNSQQRVAEQAMQFIEGHISSPEINTATIAGFCRVSQRYLHYAFASLGYTVAGYVRERRLQLCRAALLDPYLVNRSITRIASDWGFRDPSQFGRAYRKRFNCAPREERECVRHAPQKQHVTV